MKSLTPAPPAQDHQLDQQPDHQPETTRVRPTGRNAPLFPRLTTQSVLLARALTRQKALGEGLRSKVYHRHFGTPIADETLSEADYEPVVRVARENLSPETLKMVLRSRVPVVLEGAALGSPAVDNWTLPYLAKHHGDIPVPTFQEHTGAFNMTMAQAVESILKEDGTGVQINNVCDVLLGENGLIGEVPVGTLAKLAPQLTYHGANMFVCGAGDGSKYHCANEVNFFVQIHGRKEWNFIHPKFTPQMDPLLTLPRCSYFGSGIPWGHHPANVPIKRAVLEPGDVLVNPPWWWHWVRNRTATIGVATRWRTWSHRFGTENAYFSAIQWLFPHQWKILWHDYLKGGHLDDAKWVHRGLDVALPDAAAPKD